MGRRRRRRAQPASPESDEDVLSPAVDELDLEDDGDDTALDDLLGTPPPERGSAGEATAGEGAPPPLPSPPDPPAAVSRPVAPPLPRDLPPPVAQNGAQDRIAVTLHNAAIQVRGLETHVREMAMAEQPSSKHALLLLEARRSLRRAERLMMTVIVGCTPEPGEMR